MVWVLIDIETLDRIYPIYKIGEETGAEAGGRAQGKDPGRIRSQNQKEIN
jgi:hypothetical protein